MYAKPESTWTVCCNVRVCYCVYMLLDPAAETVLLLSPQASCTREVKGVTPALRRAAPRRAPYLRAP